MAVGQPLEEVARLPHLVGVDARRGLGGELVDDLGDLGVHLVPVLDGLPDVAQHPLDRLLERGDVLALGDPVDLDVHPGLADALALVHLGVAVGDRPHLLEGAGDVAHHVEERVDDQVHVVQLTGELHRQRVDEEGHVVDDDLDHRVPVGRPALVARARREHPDPGGALGPGAGQPVVRGEGAVHVHVGALGDVLAGDPAVVGPEQLVDDVVRRPAAPPSAPGDLDGLGEQRGLVCFVRRR